MISGGMLVAFFVIALAAPLIERLYGIGPGEQFQAGLDGFGMPLGYAGGVSGEHWFGLEPGLGRDIFIRMIYGMRTSLFIAFAAAVVTSAIGIVAGVLAGYLGGWVDAVINWITDFALALPFLIFALAVVPTMELRFYGPRDEVPAAFRVAVLIVAFAVVRLDEHRPAGARAGDRAARAGVRRGGPGQRRRPRAHALPPVAAEHLGADPGLLLAGRTGLCHR